MAPRNRFLVLSWLIVYWSQLPAYSLERGIARFLAPSVYRLGEQYFAHVEQASKISFIPEQRTYLKNYLTCFSPIPLKPSLVKIQRKEYLKLKKHLKQEWCLVYGQPWPHEIKFVGDTYQIVDLDVHHIFHLSNGGPNLYWNIHPIEKDIHHFVIHAPGAPGEILHGKI
ncbi:MAG TPA: hypothetical protein VNJ29_01510 [Candidatus Nitrosotenuis sp.]|jgi:hypothetical protein|nr:hypothetical protein [Candidatus Nitrosotenuis sp.]